MNAETRSTLRSVRPERRTTAFYRRCPGPELVVDMIDQGSFDSTLPELLIRRIAEARDRDAFSALFRHFAPKVRAFSRSRGANRANAEELVQEVMLAVWRRAETYDPDKASAATWIYAIARNRMLDELRRPALPELSTGEVREEAAEEPQHELRIDGARAALRLRKALASLPPEQSELIQIAYYEGLSQRDLAARLDLPLGTVKSRTRLALDRLRIALKTND